MSEVIGKGVIEVSADATKLKAGVDDAKRSIKSLGKDIGDSMGTASAKASRSIDNYVKKLQTAAATQSMSARESELYTLSLKGASKAQLDAADAALRMSEGYEKGIEIGQRLRTGLIASAAALVALGAAGVVAFGKVTEGISKYQELSEKTGETASNIASLQTASVLSGVSLDTVAAASIRLTASLSKTDDESKLVGKGIKALGLNFDEFKKRSPSQQLDAVAKAMSGFADGSEKSATAVAIFGKAGAELLPFLNDLADGGERQIRLTDEQIKQADDHTKAQARLKSEITQLAQTIVANSLPAVTDLTGAMKDAITEAIGLGSEATSLKNNSSIQAFAEDGALFLATLADYAVKVGEAFGALGKTIGGVGAVQVALVKGEFKEALSIGKELVRDSKTFFNAPSFAEALEKRLAERRQNAQGFFDDSEARVPGRRRIDATDLNTDRIPKGKKDNSAAQEAKAQLTFDIDEIKKAQEALSNTIANGEKILDARRSASLISESEYYAQKRRFIQDNDQVQQAAAEKEIARLQAEKLSGKDKIDNDRKIADAQSKLAKLRENATANLQVLAIQEKDSLDSIARAYVDARTAAQSYLDVTNRARQLELDSMGQGTRTRDFGAAISQITERYEQQRQDLQRDNRNGKFAGRQEDFQRELALLNEFQGKSIASYTDYYEKLNEKQKSFSLGASEALKNYYDESQNVFKQTEEAVTNAFKGMEDALTEFTTTGKGNFKSLIDSIIKDIARMAIKQSITGPLSGLLGNALKGGSGGGSLSGDADYLKLIGLSGGSGLSITGGSGGGLISSLLSGILGGGRAIGGPVSAGQMYRVNEKGPGEMFEAGGKQWFMPGMNGEVKPSAGGSREINYSPTFVLNEPASRKTQAQLAKIAGQGLQRVGRDS